MEEPAWLVQVREARDRCRGAIATAVICGTLLVALTKLVPFLHAVFVVNEGASLTVAAGKIIGMIYPCTDCGSNESNSSRYTWIAYSWSYAGSYFVPVIPDWGFSFCQMLRGFLFLASACILLAVGRFTKPFLGDAAGSFAQFLVLIYFIASCLVIPDLKRLFLLQATMTLGTFPCLTGMCWSARRTLRKDGHTAVKSLGQQNSVSDRRHQRNG